MAQQIDSDADERFNELREEGGYEAVVEEMGLAGATERSPVYIGTDDPKAVTWVDEDTGRVTLMEPSVGNHLQNDINIRALWTEWYEGDLVIDPDATLRVVSVTEAVHDTKTHVAVRRSVAAEALNVASRFLRRTDGNGQWVKTATRVVNALETALNGE